MDATGHTEPSSNTPKTAVIEAPLDTLRAAVIGLGVGERHIAGYEAAGAIVTVLCDLDADKRRDLAERHPDKHIAGDPISVLTDPEIDVVSIASYDDAHATQVIAAIENGKHVFAEKPLCLTRAEAVAIRSALRANPKVHLSCNLILRRSPRLQRVRQMINDGEFGSLFHIGGEYNYGRLAKLTHGWRGENPRYSVVLGGGIHLIDQMVWMTGQRVTEVAAFSNGIASANSGFCGDDMAAAILRFESGMTGTLTANYGCVLPHGHELSVFGTKATFINGSPDAKLFRSRDPEQAPLIITDAHPGAEKGDLVERFIEQISSARPPEIDVDEVFDALSVCLAIDRSRQERRVIEVEHI